ncbi:MAG: FtsQ-type POTRA domain-containing protein [Chloroflexaceae bacterium]|jgi:cell division protein FtsQ|nr:FtsQ-type POTRA domain-containing protein [Chloroflexaceae bacterium]
MDYNTPNTKARVEARRVRTRTTVSLKHESQVQPGPRRAMQAWLLSGRLFSAGLLLVVLGVLAYLFSSNTFTVQQVQVEGTSALKPEAVVELAGLNGTPIWYVDEAAAMERLLQNPYVERASMRVALPNQAVVTIVERRPEVRWQLGPVQYLVDSSGKVLDSSEQLTAVADESRPFLVIVDTSKHLLEPGDQVDPDALKLAQVLALRLPAELNVTPAQIGWDFALGVYIRLASNQTVVFGRSERLDEKLSIFKELLKDSTQFTYMDLRPTTPFYQNVQPAQPTATSQQP